MKEGLLSVKAVKSLELPLDQRDLIVRSVKDGYFSLDVSSRGVLPGEPRRSVEELGTPSRLREPSSRALCVGPRVLQI